MFVRSCPHAGNMEEPIKQRNILLILKLIAEGSPGKWQIVLGWLIDTHLFLIPILPNKFEAWQANIDTFIQTGQCTQDSIDTFVGHLKHTATITRLGQHFLA